jgi:hypothetical protein
MLDQLLTGKGIEHAWQGATMIVRAADESDVDDLVEEVEHATLPTLDPELEQVVYEMAGWTAEQQTLLSERLGAQGIPHEFDASGDLVAHAEDEDRIEALLDDLERAPLVASTGHDDTDGDDDGDDEEPIDLDGLDVNEVLSALFSATDRLRKNARDSNGVLKFLDNAPTVARMGMPFGFERPVWDGLVDQVAEIESLLDDNDSDDAVIEERAKHLRDALHALI